nr:MAG TPA: hypothetical protein [Caudoviricetes sp.]
MHPLSIVCTQKSVNTLPVLFYPKSRINCLSR